MRLRRVPLALAALWATSASAQYPLMLDTNFRVVLQSQSVNSIMQLADGDLILSGRLRLEGEWSDRSMIKVDAYTGVQIPVAGGLYGGGKLTRWEEKYYVGNGQTLRRLNANGTLDPAFDEPNLDPTFASLQGGDYHVYPDGRLLVSGWHQLYDANGDPFLHSLIWFTDSGWVDHTRTHRKSNAPVYVIKEEPDGQFLCFYTGTQYEGQATNGRIFRISADGVLDTTLQSRVTSGTVFSLLPLPDGRFYATGKFYRTGVQGMVRLARFSPNGELDPTFNNNLEFSRGELPDDGTGATIGAVKHWHDGKLLVMGTYQFVNDEPRRGICAIDTTGQLLEEFAGCGVGPTTYQGLTTASVRGYLETDDGMAYIWGTYHGYNDGTTNDTLQRFVSRLYGPDTPTTVTPPTQQERAFGLFPNPASEQVTFIYRLRTANNKATVRVQDALGRDVALLLMPNEEGQLVLDTRELGSGMYTVRYCNAGVVEQVDKLIVQ